MVSNIPPLLFDWWEDLSSSDKKHVKKYLGNLPSLLDIEPNKKLIEAATLFWDNERAMFRFVDIEITPLLEEIGGLAGLTWDSPRLFVPENHTGGGFLKMMGLKKNVDLVFLKDSYIPFDYIYERYGHIKSLHTYHDEIALTSLGHIHRRVFVFILCFLGMIVFLMKTGRIHIRSAIVAKTLMEGINGQTYTIVPMIIADIYWALERCQRGVKHFTGCNLLLQLWLLEHLQKGRYRQEFS